jgi:hypothetical protein
MRHAQAPANNVVEPEPPCELVRQFTVKLAVLVPVPLAVVTATLPVTAPAGTIAVICVAEFTVKLLAARPPKVTFVAPVKLVPVIVTVVPTVPLVGVKLLIPGLTLKFEALVAVPPAFTTETGPVVAPAGTVALIH